MSDDLWGDDQAAVIERPPLWPHQASGLDELGRAVDAGEKAICVTSPTGGGKTTIISCRIEQVIERGGRVALFTNRKILTNQASGRLRDFGLEHGVMAAGHDPRMWARVQVCSLQTVGKRVFARKEAEREDAWELPNVDEVHIDEAHSNKAETATKIISHYKARGVPVIGWTATPVGLAGIYDKLIVAGRNSDLRRCGSLVRCDVYAPTEPDMKGVRFNAVGEYVQDEMRKRVMQCTVFGDVFSHWRRLNPDGRPTLMWAPGVQESKWFAEQWRREGVTAGHIDGETPEEERKELFAASKEGRIKVLCSCGVMREGADLPWVSHGILCQPCGALSTYLQIVGRILRAHPESGKTLAIMQDHAGAWHRHGSPNWDRDWDLSDTDKSIAKQVREQREQGKEQEPICCPRCGGIRRTGAECPFCGHSHVKSVRAVRMVDGTLKKMVGPTVKVKRQKSAEQKAWDSALFAAGRSRRTVEQARAIYFNAVGNWPPEGLRNMPPASSTDWQRRAGDVYPFTVHSRRKRGTA